MFGELRYWLQPKRCLFLAQLPTLSLAHTVSSGLTHRGPQSLPGPHEFAQLSLLQDNKRLLVKSHENNIFVIVTIVGPNTIHVLHVKLK